MADFIYNVTGQVIDRDSSLGVADVNVQAWDTNPQRDQMLAATQTDENGRFSASFDLRRLQYETPPDIFFKVLRGERLLESTENSVLWNTNTQENVTIRIRLGKERVPGRDRITTAQVLKGVEFFQKSDFKGVYREYQARAGSSFGLVTDMFVNAFANMDVEPVRVKGTRQNDVINQDVEAARKNLAAKNIAVAEVLPYKPGLNNESLTLLTTLPRNIKPGQEVRLYEENGRVKYYAIVKTGALSTDDMNAELTKLQEELKVTREAAARKDEQITTLQQQLAMLSKDQMEINTVLRSEGFARLIKEMDKPRQPVPKTQKKPNK